MCLGEFVWQLVNHEWNPTKEAFKNKVFHKVIEAGTDISKETRLHFIASLTWEY